MFENLDALVDYFDDDSEARAQVAVQDREGTVSIIAADEYGALFYTQVPTDERGWKPVDYIAADSMLWPLVRLVPEPRVSGGS